MHSPVAIAAASTVAVAETPNGVLEASMAFGNHTVLTADFYRM
jgi:2-succinyl-5-enolpyruvyl-6-hydroxy-3-cyclohexene-1-carboxylate synthase